MVPSREEKRKMVHINFVPIDGENMESVYYTVFISSGEGQKIGHNNTTQGCVVQK